MAKAIILIGRLCCGKTTYAQQVIAREGGVLISADELMQTIFPEPLGDEYDKFSARGIQYLYHLTRQLVQGGVNAVLDFGGWNPASRKAAKDALAGLEQDWRYLDVPQDEWERRIAKRNAAIAKGEGKLNEYYVDEGLLDKANRLFQPPTEDEGLNFTVIHT